MTSNLKLVAGICLFFCLLISPLQASTTATAELPGDHFSLEAALSLFEEAKSLEAFEKALNTEKHHVNNLDLDEDGKVDYIRVVAHQNSDLHAIVLQVAVNQTEFQDVAVIEIEKIGDQKAQLQIVGDEDLYGEEKIVEPFDVAYQQEGKGPSLDFSMTRIVVNVWTWPAVRFIYGTRYRPYVSPWRWRVYPNYWKPWRRHSLSYHRQHIVVRPHFRVTRTHRLANARRVYLPKRQRSTVVRTRTTVVRNRKGKVVAKRKTTTVRNNGKQRKVVRTKTKRKVRKRRN